MCSFLYHNIKIDLWLKLNQLGRGKLNFYIVQVVELIGLKNHDQKEWTGKFAMKDALQRAILKQSVLLI